MAKNEKFKGDSPRVVKVKGDSPRVGTFPNNQARKPLGTMARVLRNDGDSPRRTG